MRKAPLIVAVLTVFLTVAAFPPFNFSSTAYIFVAPMLYWACHRPTWKVWLWTNFLSGWLSWCILLIWLRHVTVGGLLLLSAIVALFYLAWSVCVRWLMPCIESANTLRRILAIAGVASAWVVLEWIRGWILTGFPWLPLAASQWERPVMLQMSQWTGSGGIAFVLVFFNVSIVSFIRRVQRNRIEKVDDPGVRLSFPAELLIAVVLLFGQVMLYTESIKEALPTEPMFRVGLVQPKAPILLHFDNDVVRECLAELKSETKKLATEKMDFILWPETALTLLPLVGDPYMCLWASELAKELDCKILGGALANVNKNWFNALYVIDPILGVKEPFYAKRKLVPFGEYVPFEKELPFIRRFVPYEGQFGEGVEPTLLTVFSRTRGWEVGGLICYEDVFPSLARASVLAGADWLVVVTNNGWFGEEGGAYQHAAHSVLRAVENRRPVVRCGNAGWSGWIDEYGRIRKIITDASGTIYFRGNGVIEVSRSTAWAGRTTFYTRHGDIFVYVCIALLGLSLAVSVMNLKRAFRSQDTGFRT